MFRDLIRALAVVCALAIYAAAIFWPHYGLKAHPALLAALVAAQLLVAFLVILKPEPRRRVLRWIFTGGGLFAVAALASACAGMPGITMGASTKDVLADVQACQRHYTGTLGATGFTGSLDIQCSPVTNGDLKPLLPGATVAPTQTPATPATAPQ